MVLAVREQDQRATPVVDLPVVDSQRGQPGLESRRERRSRNRDRVDADRLEEQSNGTVIQRQGASQMGLTRERHESHAIPRHAIHERSDRVLGLLEPGRCEVFR